MTCLRFGGIFTTYAARGVVDEGHSSMTITTRSKRVSIFGAAPTPSAVGPGAYAPERQATSFRNEHRPLYSGFAASEKRDLNANKTTSAVTPGPGAYSASLQDQTGYIHSIHSPAGVQSNVFATKISRFAPSAPGSTVFLPSSIQDNPGPGAYAADPMPSLPRYHHDDARSDARPVAPTKPSVPTIPRKEQSYGYAKDPLNGELRLQAQPSNIYSGLGQDTVGPAAYNSHAAIWNERKNVAPSIKSTVKREVWEEYNTPRREVPGPGQYDPPDPRGLKGSTKRASAGDRPSAVFASRVPILPDPKRAEHYDPEKELEIMTKEQRAPYKPRSHKSKVEAFGSTTGRADIAVQLNAPFSSPSFKATPGPGKYTEHSPGNFSSFRNGSMRRASHKPRGAAYRDDQHIGFTSATERHCLSKSKPSTSPGPGAYKSETPRTVEKAVKNKQTVGRFGVFGSTSERHVWERLEAMEPDEITPAPGAYDRPVETHGGHFPMLVSSAAFKSSSSRFARLGNPHASPHVHCVGDTTAPAVGQYNLSFVGAAPGSPGEEEVPQTSPLHSSRAPFLSTAERSVFDAKETKYVPGPGQYESDLELDLGGVTKPQVLTRSREVRATLGNEQRFRVKPRVPAHVGPGAYAIPGTVGTKSFNVTMAPKPAR